MKRLQAGEALVGAVQAGWLRLESRREELNQMNVFPVPDGDTGENMSMTLRYALAVAKKERPVKLPEAVRALADGALQGARGNSGVILSQLFRGFAQSLGDRHRFTSEAFVVGLEEGYQTAYRAISQPMEGTILSVARASAEGARVGLNQSPSGSWRAVLAAALNASVEALFHTPMQLPQLRQAGVVDAGGQGWLYFLEGVADFVLGGRAVMDWKRDPRLRALQAKTLQPSQRPPFSIDGMDLGDQAEMELPMGPWPEALKEFETSVPFPYDLEFMLVAPGLSPADVELALRPLGDSLIVSPAIPGETIKVHIHTDDLAPIFQYACQQGELIDLHLQNMRQQAVRAKLKQTAAHAGRQGEGKVTYGSTSAPAEAPKVQAIAVVSGDEFARMYRQAGAHVIHAGDAVISGNHADFVLLHAQLMASIHRSVADELLLIPTHESLLPLVEQAVRDANRPITVVHSRNQAEGLAALLSLDKDSELSGQLPAMRAAVASLSSGTVSRLGDASDRHIVWQGKIGDRCVVEGETLDMVLLRLIDTMWDEAPECIAIYLGARQQTDDVESFRQQIEQQFTEAEVEVLVGGQEDSDVLVVIE